MSEIFTSQVFHERFHSIALFTRLNSLDDVVFPILERVEFYPKHLVQFFFRLEFHRDNKLVSLKQILLRPGKNVWGIFQNSIIKNSRNKLVIERIIEQLHQSLGSKRIDRIFKISGTSNTAINKSFFGWHFYSLA